MIRIDFPEGTSATLDGEGRWSGFRSRFLNRHFGLEDLRWRPSSEWKRDALLYLAEWAGRMVGAKVVDLRPNPPEVPPPPAAS